MIITCHRDLSVNIVILPHRLLLGAWPPYFQVRGALVTVLQRSLVWGHQVWTRIVSVRRRMTVVWRRGWPRARVRGVRGGQHHPPGYRGYPPSLTSAVTSTGRGRGSRSREDAASCEGDSLNIRLGLLIHRKRESLMGGWNNWGINN